jgi:hypothetical protein
MTSNDQSFGFLTMALGRDPIVRACALARSVHLHEPDTGLVLITDDRTKVPGGYFADIIEIERPEPFSGYSRYLNKLVQPFKLSPFDRTMFFDDDTLLIRPIRRAIEEMFAGSPISACATVQYANELSPGINHLVPAATCEALGRSWIYNLYGGGHYYFESGPEADRILEAALAFAVESPDLYERVATPGQAFVSDEIAFLYAANQLECTLPTPSDFIDPLNLKRANEIHIDVAARSYVWAERSWGRNINDVHIVHFCANGKRSLPYSREIYRLTGLRQSFDEGLKGRSRRIRQTLRAQRVRRS